MTTPNATEIRELIADTDGPWKRHCTASAGEVYDAALAADGHPAPVRVIRGKRATTAEALFDEISAALQFPPHFGRNRDALLDCLRDARDRHPAGLTLVVLDAPYLLSTDEAARGAFERLLEQAHADADDIRPTPRDKGFRLVLHQR